MTASTSSSSDQLSQMLHTLLRSFGERPSRDGTLLSGETRGPFPCRELGAEPSEGENMLTLHDPLGNPHHFEVTSSDPILRRIKPVADARHANCVVFINKDNELQLMITRSIGPDEDLTAAFLPQNFPSTADMESEKRFLCPQCKLAKFNGLENLEAHQKFYCTKRDSSATSPKLEMSPPMMPLHPNLPSMSGLPLQNFIMFPLAYHDQPQRDLVQLLGPPQTIVPVAIGRQNAPVTTPLLIQRGLCASVQVPTSFQYSFGGVSVTVPIINLDGPSSSLKRACPSRTPSTPLDLSKRQRAASSSGESTPAPVTKPLSSDVEKPFVCTCGVAFSVESTLHAHQQFYCKDVERPEDQREPTRKLPSRCSQCDFEPQSLSQLSVHVRNAHNEIQAYICKVCGYRGYSLRGIRSHMRSHPQLDYMKFETLLATHVSKLRAEPKNPPKEASNNEVKPKSSASPKPKSKSKSKSPPAKSPSP